MAPLSSIPEASSSLHSTFDTDQPRSRAVFLSRRPGRARASLRKSPLSKRLQSCPPENPGYNGAGSPKKHRRDLVNKASPRAWNKPKTSPTCTKTPSSTSPNTQRLLHESKSPFDLDSFPEPPTTNTATHSVKDQPPIATQPANRCTAPKPPLALSQRKLLVPAQRPPANIHNSLKDAATDIFHPSKRQSVDSALVAAVSRSIAQQLRLVSRYSGRNSPHCDNASRTSSQHHALNRFTKDLEAYAKQTSAKGKLVDATPTPSVDAATLHTVSEFLPYRPQLRAAGLAVTSKEQGQGVPHYLKQLQPDLQSHTLRQQRRAGRDKPAQLDGYDDSGPSQSTGTEISFAQTQNMDEFRYALIDEIPARKKKRRSMKKWPARRCLPCFPARDEPSSDTDWAHFRVPSAKSKVLQKRPLQQSGQTELTKTQVPKTRGPKYVSPHPHSPRQKPNTQEAGNALPVEDTTYQWERPNFITTGRRHSMTLPKPKGRHEAPNAGPRHRYGGDTYDQIANYSAASLNHSRPQGGDDAIKSRQAGRSVPTEPQINLSARPSQSKFGKSVEILFDSQADELRRRGTQADATRQHPPRPARPSRNKRTSVLQYDPYHIGICCPKNRGVPAKLTARPNIPRRSSSIRVSSDSIEIDFDDREISDRDVLRGLHVAASAACNEEIDAFVRNKTGLRIRRFLADLMALETITAVRPGEDSEQHARRRRAEMRKLKQQVRRSREIVMAGGLI